MGLGMAGLFAGIGLSVLFTGMGLVWASRPATEKVKAPAFKQVANAGLTAHRAGPTPAIRTQNGEGNRPRRFRRSCEPVDFRSVQVRE